jgi:hypothetical protein
MHRYAATLKNTGMASRYGVKVSPVRIGRFREWRVWLIDREADEPPGEKTA